MLLTLALLTGSAIGGSDFLFHGKKVSFDKSNQEHKGFTLYRDGHPLGKVPEHHTEVYTYDIEFFDHTAMVQLDHGDLKSVISSLHCSSNMVSLDMCFNSEEDRTEFWAEIQAEVQLAEHDDEFIVSTSDHMQLATCRRHMDRISMIRAVDVDSCMLSSVEGESCLSCSHTHKLTHGDLINNGEINIRNRMHHESPDEPVRNTDVDQPSRPVAANPHARRLLADRVYSVEIFVSVQGGTDEPIWLVIEGENGKTQPWQLDSDELSGGWEGQSYTYEVTLEDVGDISKVYLVNYGSNKLCLNNVKIGADGSEFNWYSASPYITGGIPRCVEYESGYDHGCGVAEFSNGNYFSSDSREETPCLVIPPVWDVVEPRTYTLEIDVCEHALVDIAATDADVFAIIEGHLGVSVPFKLSLTEEGESFSIDVTSDIDVGYVNHVHLVMYSDDGLWLERLAISTKAANAADADFSWEWEFPKIFDIGCAGFDYSPLLPFPGCGVFTVDFGTNRIYDVDQIPCEIIPDEYANATKWDLLVTWAATSFQRAIETVGRKFGAASVNTTRLNDIEQTHIDFYDEPFELPFECNKEIRDFNVSFNGTYNHDGTYDLSLHWVAGVVTYAYSNFEYEKALSVDFEAFSNGMVTVLDIDELLYSGPLYTYGISAGPLTVGVGIGLDLRAGGQLRTDTYIRGRYDWNVWGQSSLEYTAPDGNIFTPMLQPFYSVDRDFNLDIYEYTTDTFVSVFIFPILSLFVDAVIDQRNLVSVGVKPSIDVQFWYDSNLEIKDVETCKFDLEVHFGLAVGVGTQILPHSPYYELFNQKWPVYDGCLDTTILKIANFTADVKETVGNAVEVIKEKKQAIHDYVESKKGCIKKKICRSSFNESRHQCDLPIMGKIREVACTETTVLDVIEKDLRESWGRVGKVYQGTKCLLISKWYLLKEFLLEPCDSGCSDESRRRRLILDGFGDTLFGVVMNHTDGWGDKLKDAANATITKARHFVKAVVDYVDLNVTAIKKNAVRLMKVTSETVKEAVPGIITAVQCVATEMEDVEMDPEAILAAATTDRTVECVQDGITTTSEILVENMEQYNFALKAIPAIVTLTDVSVELLTELASQAQGASLSRRRLQDAAEDTQAVTYEDFALDDGVYYGNLVCQRCHEGNCDSAIKHFQMDIYEDGSKAQLSSNYMGNYALGNLDVIFDESTLMHCVGDVLCGTMEIPIGGENRFFFGEVFNSCRARHFCGFDAHDEQNITTFVFWEGLEEPVEDDLYSWENKVVANDLSEETCKQDAHKWVTLPPANGITPTTADNADTTTEEDVESAMSTGAIIGIVIGALCGVVFIGIILVMCVNRQPRGKAGFEQTASDGYNN